MSMAPVPAPEPMPTNPTITGASSSSKSDALLMGGTAEPMALTPAPDAPLASTATAVASVPSVPADAATTAMEATEARSVPASQTAAIPADPLGANMTDIGRLAWYLCHAYACHVCYRCHSARTLQNQRGYCCLLSITQTCLMGWHYARGLVSQACTGAEGLLAPDCALALGSLGAELALAQFISS